MRRRLLFRAKDREFELGVRTLIMGVVNVTPDSFSDGGRFLEADAAVEHGLVLVRQGADALDIGGESSRPGARVVPAQEELDRVLPVIEGIRKASDVALSVDTCKSEVAEAAVHAGAEIINDISSLRFDARMAEVVSLSQAGVVLMHMRGNPQTMQQLPPSKDILKDVDTEFVLAVRRAEAAGIARDRIILDPGIGFGKTPEDNLRILHRLNRFQCLGFPLMVGTSRKSFIGHVLETPVEDRIPGTIASTVAAVINGAHLVRVHDVFEVQQAVRLTDAILNEEAIR